MNNNNKKETSFIKLLKNKDFSDYKPTLAQKLFKGDNANILRDSLFANTDNPYQILAVMANDIIESGVDPDAEYASVAKGIGMWEGGNTPKDLQGQIHKQMVTLFNPNNKEYSLQWTHGGEGTGYKSWKDAYLQFKNAKDIDTAIYSLTNGYTRPKERKERLKAISKEIKNLIDYIEEPSTKSKQPIKKMAYGGAVPIEVEDGEVAQLPNNTVVEFNGARHEQGGISTALPVGTDVYSDRIKIDNVSLSDRKKKRIKRSMKLSELYKKFNDKLLENTIKRTQQIHQIEEESDLAVQDNVRNMIEYINQPENEQEQVQKELPDEENLSQEELPEESEYSEETDNKEINSEEIGDEEYATNEEYVDNEEGGSVEELPEEEFAAYGWRSFDPNQNWFNSVPNINSYIPASVKGQATIENPEVTEQYGLKSLAHNLSKMYNSDEYKNTLLLDSVGSMIGDIGLNLISRGLKSAFKYGGKVTSLPKAEYGIPDPLNTYRNFKPISDDWYTNKYNRFWDYVNNNPNSITVKNLLNDINNGKFGEIGGNELFLEDALRLAKDNKKGPVHQAFFNYANKMFVNPLQTSIPELKVPTIKRPITGITNDLKKNINNVKNDIGNKQYNKIPLSKSTFGKLSKKVFNTIGDFIPTMGDMFIGYGIGKGIANSSDITERQFANTKPNINPYLQYGLAGLDTLDNSMQYVNRQRDNQLQDLNLSRNAAINRNRNSARSINTLRALDNITWEQGERQRRQLQNAFDQQLLGMMNQKTNLQNARDRMVMGGEYQRDLADRQDLDNYYTNLKQDEVTKLEGIQHLGRLLNLMKSNKVAENIIDGLSEFGFGYDRFGNLFNRSANSIQPTKTSKNKNSNKTKGK